MYSAFHSISKNVTSVFMSSAVTNRMAYVLGSAGMGNETMQENYRMLGAIAVHPSGAVFFKLTGPRETVGKWERSFDEFLGSLTPRENQI